jgi:Helix-turn-helix.
MEEKGYTIREFASVAGVTHATIVRARSDKWIAECRLSTLGRIANALEVPLKDLFEGEYQAGE